MNVLLKGREVDFYLEDPGAKLLFAWHDFAEAAEKGAEEAGAECILVEPGDFLKQVMETDPVDEVADRAGDDTAVILYTSGTTGKPKGAELTHDNLYKNCTVASKILGDISKDDVLLGALPLFHSFGQTCTMNAAASRRARCSRCSRASTPTRRSRSSSATGVTIFQGVPTMYNAMLHSRERRQRRHLVAARLHVGRLGDARGADAQLRGGVRLQGPRGLRPVGDLTGRLLQPPRQRAQARLDRHPIEGVEMKVVDDDGNEVDQGEVGEIVIKGHNVMKGYWNRPEATEDAIKDGWFYTGDMAKVDEDGYFFIVDRKKELIIRGGYNVYPREIEEVLYEHPPSRRPPWWASRTRRWARRWAPRWCSRRARTWTPTS